MRANTDIEPTAKSLATDRVVINVLSVASSSLPNNELSAALNEDIPQVFLGDTASGNSRQGKTHTRPERIARENRTTIPS
jgi:hypothetical protein